MLKLLKNLRKKEIACLIISVIFIVAQVWLDLKMPDYMSKITELVQTNQSSMKDILVQGGYMLACALLSFLSAVVVGYFASNLAASFARGLRSKVFNKVLDFSTEEIKKFSTSSLITRTTNDVSQVQMLLSVGTQMIIKAPIMAVWAVIKISGKNFTWSMITAVAVLILIIMIVSLIIMVLPRFKVVQKLIDNLNRIIRENLTGIRVIRAYNAEKYQENKFKAANDELTSTQTFNQRMMAIISPVMNIIMQGLTLAIYLSGAYIINEANMGDKIGIFSDMVVFSSYAIQVLSAFMMLALIFIIYPRASVSAKRITEVLDTPLSLKDGTKDVGNEVGTVEFRNVSFKYPDAEEYMLHNITFKAKKGETVAFIGSTGSGKSTVINLIPRFYDATEGQVLVDGIDVKEYKQEKLHNIIGYISQKAVMFDGTITDNISYGDNGKEKPSMQKIEEAVRIAQATDFVEKMQDKYESHIAQGGTNVSGGQKQRLSTARAIAREPEIYIFDDSFSALDYKTEFNLRQALKEYTKDATNLIVAQRIGTIKEADQIIVLDQGNVVGHGTHKELLKNCEVYKEIALSQLSKEELEG